MADPEITNNADESRYEIRVEGALAGFAEYRTRPDHIVFTHTEIDPKFEGQGLGSKLIRAALDDTKRQGLGISSVCPFVTSFIERHPEYAS